MEPAAAVTFYWRPGCPFCHRLRRDLRGAGVPVTEVNIWEDPAAAAHVRSIAGGNETVPTVTLGDRSWVNPRAADVLDEVRRINPDFAPDPDTIRSARRDRALAIVQWVLIAALVAGSYATDIARHTAVSWTLDGVAVGVYLLFRGVLRPRARG